MTDIALIAQYAANLQEHVRARLAEHRTLVACRCILLEERKSIASRMSETAVLTLDLIATRRCWFPDESAAIPSGAQE